MITLSLNIIQKNHFKAIGINIIIISSSMPTKIYYKSYNLWGNVAKIPKKNLPQNRGFNMNFFL